MQNRLCAGLATIVCWSLLGGVAQAQDAKDFIGKYAYAGSSGEQAARASAVKQALDGLNAVFRLVAKPFLNGVTKIPANVQIVLQGTNIGIQIDPYPMRVSDLNDGPMNFRGTTGQASVMKRHWQGAAIVEMVTSASGSRGNTYQLSSGGQNLVIQTSFQSSQLTRPLLYTLTFRKQ